MQAGVFLQLISRDELAQRMEQLHRLVFEQSVAEHRNQQANTWPHEALDYSEYDAPAFERYPAGRDVCIVKGVVECDDTSAMDAEGRDR